MIKFIVLTFKFYPFKKLIASLNCGNKLDYSLLKGKIKYDYDAKMWQHASPGGWYFVSLPKKLSIEIREHLKWQEEGWGRMKAFAKIGEIIWETSIWFDTKKDTYILPIKAEIRKKSKLKIDQIIQMSIWI